MARSYAIILCLALFCAVAFAGGYDDKCEYSYEAVPRYNRNNNYIKYII